MHFIFDNGWIIFIVVTFGTGLILKFTSKKYIQANPELEKGYDNYLKGWLIFGNIPWVIMMVGNLSGLTNSTLDYFYPREMNPMVLIFHFSIITIWILSVRWIFFRNGAEFIEKHPGLFQISTFDGVTNASSKQVKLFFFLMILGGVIGMILMWKSDFN